MKKHKQNGKKPGKGVTRRGFLSGYETDTGCNQTATCNNGNVMSQTITPPGSWSATQAYGYDAVNRLSSATESGTYGWSENFGYNAYGNQWVSGYSGFPSLSPLTPTAST